MSDKMDTWNEGLKVLEAVYGPGSSEMMRGHENSPFVSEIVTNQFGKTWADSALSIRDKRLMVLGATVMLGRADLVEIQMTGALKDDEFADEQIEQIPLFMLFYAGAPNTTALCRGIRAARKNMIVQYEDINDKRVYHNIVKLRTMSGAITAIWKWPTVNRG